MTVTGQEKGRRGKVCRRATSVLDPIFCAECHRFELWRSRAVRSMHGCAAGYGNRKHGTRTRSRTRRDGIASGRKCSYRYHWKTGPGQSETLGLELFVASGGCLGANKSSGAKYSQATIWPTLVRRCVTGIRFRGTWRIWDVSDSTRRVWGLLVERGCERTPSYPHPL